MAVFIFLIQIALYKANFFFFFLRHFFPKKKSSQGLLNQERTSKEKYNIKTLLSSSKPHYSKANESDLLFSLNFHMIVADFIQLQPLFTAPSALYRHE